jgi:hypothetical protein
MNSVCTRSFWLGMHSALLIVALTLLPISLWFLFTVVLCGACAYANWSALKDSPPSEA